MPGDNISFELPNLTDPDFRKSGYVYETWNLIVYYYWIGVDEASPSEDEEAAQAALRLPQTQGSFSAIYYLLVTESVCLIGNDAVYTEVCSYTFIKSLQVLYRPFRMPLTCCRNIVIATDQFVHPAYRI
jgi:hypothetical protein